MWKLFDIVEPLHGFVVLFYVTMYIKKKIATLSGRFYYSKEIGTMVLMNTNISSHIVYWVIHKKSCCYVFRVDIALFFIMAFTFCLAIFCYWYYRVLCLCDRFIFIQLVYIAIKKFFNINIYSPVVFFCNNFSTDYLF